MDGAVGNLIWPRDHSSLTPRQQVYNVIGFTCYSIFNGLFYWSKPVQQEYMDRHNGKHNQVRSAVAAWRAACATCHGAR